MTTLLSIRTCPGRHSIIGRAALAGHTVQVSDVLEDAEFVNTAAQRLIGFRAILVTPMLREGESIGTLGFSSRTRARSPKNRSN